MAQQTISDIMTRQVNCCIPEDNIYEAAVKMKTWDVGIIPVVSNDQLLGVITDRDIVIRGVAERKPNSTQVTEVMTADVITCSPDTTVDEAAQLMSRHQIRRLPVVEGNKLVGIVALGDLAVREIHEDEAEAALSEISERRGETDTQSPTYQS
ncbi:CBS domain containing protein [Caldalkalibacillus thermarum TA2.A1]|uniref:CBS domain-containing protein n=1 Tax=Caldalkalibacillus thermarum (strain TA2.A1) TaxID=986075 RepID=F5LAB0_CALTT|nr:CBS domain-containing protein [Caldalkalibacillus thermarum]EGL81659.1 CBS domain containing protein [Caldalkalibacillus thermarum TA2.A1]QZT33256.1 CBS domain-containing protein [Caldalkalibacillus thermarum TA2.A1]GGK27659.1 CBS domain-containing protein [Caldalkalibacillus thermarum]